MRGFREQWRSELLPQVVSFADDGHGNARRLEPEERRLSATRSVHVHERRIPP
jgi:hypothetical protein